MLLRITGGILLIICGALSGFYYSFVCIRRTEMISSYIRFLSRTRNMISYLRLDIRSVLMRSLPEDGMVSLINNTLREMDRGSSFEEAWTASVEKLVKGGAIFPGDKDIFAEFSRGFGEYGTEEEIQKLDMIMKEAESRLKNRREDNASRLRIYRAGGVFCGVMAAVILL